MSKGQKQIGEMGGPGGPVCAGLWLAIKGCGRQGQARGRTQSEGPGARS